MSEADFSDIPDDFAFDEPVRSEAGGAGSDSTPYAHPWVVFFQLIFKVIALVLYLVLYYTLTNGFVLTFIFTTLCCAADFWVCKNVAGRLLVGLRWWNAIKEDGTSEWVFESRADRTNVHRGEAGLFWTSLIVFAVIWLVFTLKNLIGLEWEWAVLDVIAMMLSMANMVGYLKCAQAARRLRDVAGRYVVNQAVSEGISNLGGRGGGD